MLDKKRILENPEEIKAQIKRRNKNVDDTVDLVVKHDIRRRELLLQSETLKARQNEASKQIPQIKKSGGDASELLAEMKEISQKIPSLDNELKTIDEELRELLLGIPNVPNAQVPDGFDETGNVEVRRVGSPPVFDFVPKPHWEIGEALGILDPQTAAKVTGARFHFYRGFGAKLERACMNFFLDCHAKHGYTEIFPPFLANSTSMTGTGQLPKFAEDMFKVENTDFYLIPTAEVPLTNMLRDDILEPGSLPQQYCGYSACFRAEGGSAGRDTRGLIRQHQFNKVELVHFTLPEESYDALERLTSHAEYVLSELGLPFRTVLLCAGDMGANSAKTYDIEVWMPSYGRYVEISSCSNFEDYQARRANIRFRPSLGGKLQFVHTLNGSGVAIGRTVAAILENFQRADGSVQIPEALKKYIS